MDLALVETGLANVASVRAAFARLGVDARPTTDPAVVAQAARVVLPGVGAFGAGMAALTRHGLVGPLRARVEAGRPTLAICLGLQLLADASDEDPGVPGVGALPVPVRRLPGGVRVPQLGWNAVEVGAGAALLRPGFANFAHSYALFEAPPGWVPAWVTHGARVIAAVERGAVLGCQLHPELSGDWGAALLGRWLDGPGPAAAQSAAPPPGLRPRLVPCLDVKDGRVVKGVRFQGLRDAGDPVERAAAYAAQGADELVVLDVSAGPEARATAAHTVAAVRAVLPVPLTVGGGVRSVDDAARLLDAGADKVAVNSAAVADPALLGALAARFGRQCVVLALDAARRPDGAPGWEVVVASGRTRTGRDAVAWAAEAVARGAGEVLLTSWDQDGTGEGYDLPLLRAVTAAVPVPVVASGGARTPAHLHAALDAGAEAVLMASILHDGHTTVGSLKAALAARGVELRP
jgi:imidazole glycerol phosphate synthase glutamine amidotransferase subunit